MLDPVSVAARMLLVIGCSGAALMPATLGTSEPPAGIVSRPASPPVAQATPTPDAEPVVSTPTEVVESGGTGWRGPTPRSPTATRTATEPSLQPLRFNRAEEVRQSPLWLRIPSRNIEARIVPVGINPEGEMEAPASYDQVGWYRFGAHPGDVGRSVLAGHFDSQTGAAVFYELGSLQPGDEVQIELADGELAAFTVRTVVQYPVDDAPLLDIFGHVDRPELVLITCAGQFRGPDAGYSHRAIVYADPVGS